MVNPNRRKVMYILQTTYTVTRYALIQLHHARNVCHTYKSYPEKVITGTIIVKKIYIKKLAKIRLQIKLHVNVQQEEQASSVVV